MKFRILIVLTATLLGATYFLTGFKGLFSEQIARTQPTLLDTTLLTKSDQLLTIIGGLQQVALQSTPAQQQQIYALLAAYRKHLLHIKTHNS